jgi:hypothetical protein
LERLLKVKQRQKDEAMHIEDTQRLFAEEIEMLRVVLRLARRDAHTHTHTQATILKYRTCNRA